MLNFVRQLSVDVPTKNTSMFLTAINDPREVY
jgi:hypothetical protein